MVCVTRVESNNLGYITNIVQATNLSVSKKTKMSDLVHYRLRITTIDNRNFIGQLLAYDKHLNLVLSETEESRITKKSYQELKKTQNSNSIVEEKRSLGLIILRGEQIVSLSIESPPPIDTKKRIGLEKGKGITKPLKTPVSVKSKLQGPVKTPQNAGPGFKRQ
ncbi:DEHA2B03674p [Debaryomyces hansenii CBS767]|uniref:Sm protein B n=1 Tax=Debaryomyces hansenii (strain ATCC 36239 / CBS 767 / BCRC 21394 / JCM 1990 / NBRC 0083 / IGC 2968) TaxID=284592 RepID=B5RT40_DEBHA|nr:DEHA2B03674p [Debaryomyces hansenii CBS767]CAR65445.1 DEHA2B03674p [Debaryomyces hansenii CBS767]|eukprot:XP_002770075.1 DEHA2B03674p [Debaryomyces hansenii CBS767]